MKKRPQRIALQVVRADNRAAFIAADDLSRARLRSKGYTFGDVVFAEMKKPRNPRFHRLAHQLGALVAENLDDFHGMDGHRVLKRLQIESGIGCEEIGYRLDSGQMIVQRIPQSLSFESMDEGEFREVMQGMCRHLAARYWPDCTPAQIEQMAGCMVEAA